MLYPILRLNLNGVVVSHPLSFINYVDLSHTHHQVQTNAKSIYPLPFVLLYDSITMADPSSDGGNGSGLSTSTLIAAGVATAAAVGAAVIGVRDSCSRSHSHCCTHS